MSSSALRSRAPSASLCACIAGTASSTTFAAAQDTGLPPNVPPSPPGSTASMISAGPGDAGQRQPAAQRLARDEQVGLRVVVLDRPHRPGAADAGLDLVVDPQDPVAVAQLAQLGREVGRHRDEAALALDGLEDHGRDGARIDVREEQLLQRRDRVVARHAPVRVRRRRAVDLGRERPEALLVRLDLGRQRHRHQRAAVEAAVERDDRRPAGLGARDLDGVLDRLRAGVEEDALLVGAAARETARRACGTRPRRARTPRP